MEIEDSEAREKKEWCGKERRDKRRKEKKRKGGGGSELERSEGKIECREGEKKEGG